VPQGSNPLPFIAVFFSRRPALAAAVLFVAGITLHGALPVWPIAWLLLTIIFLALAVRLQQRATICSINICIALLGIGLVAGQIAANTFAKNQVANFVGDSPRIAEIELEVTGNPRIAPGDGARHGPGKQVARAQIDRIRTVRGWESGSGEVAFTFSQPQPPLVCGQRLRVVGTLQRPAEASNPGGFDAQKYYRRQRVLALLVVNRACDLSVIGTSGRTWKVAIADRVRPWLRAGFTPHDAEDREMLVALILGERNPAIQRIEDDCNATGAIHLLASNGLRVEMLIFCMYVLCRLVRIHPRIAITFTAIAALALGMVLLPSAQALRPVIECIMVAGAMWLKRPINVVHFLGLGAIALLVRNPLDIYSAGFQMAFVVVFGMLVFARPLAKLIEDRLRNPDIDVLMQFGRATPRQLLWRRLWMKVVQLAAAGIVAWAVSLPLVAFHFEQINPWSVPIGLVLLPVTLAALVMGFAKIVLTALLPFAAPFWAWLAGIPVALLRHGIEWSARIPGVDIPTPSPSMARIVAFYLLLAMLCWLLWLPWGRMRLRMFASCGLAGACVMCILLPALVGLSPQNAQPGEVRITLLSVGAGQCAAIEPPGGRIFFFDAGSATLSDPLRTVIAPFLRHEGRSAIDGIYLSHGDLDHINAAGAMVERFGVGEVVASPFFQQHAADSSACRNLLTILDHTRHMPRLITAGDRADLGGGATAEVLWPPAKCNFNSNESGVVLRMNFAGRTVLFPADIQSHAESELLKHPENLHADVLVAPHHGSSETTTPAFVRAINPKLIVSSDDRRLTSKQRAFEQMIDGRPLYRTGSSGAITIIIDRQGHVRVEPFLRWSAAKIISN
jgi:competence protein ComEC